MLPYILFQKYIYILPYIYIFGGLEMPAQGTTTVQVISARTLSFPISVQTRHMA